MERLGDSDAFGEVLLGLLERNGWTVDRRRGFAGEGVIVTAAKGILELRHAAPTLAAAAGALLADVSRFRLYEPLPEEQLPLPL